MSDFYALLDEIAAVRYPLPEPPDEEVASVTERLVYDGMSEQARRDRQEFAENLFGAVTAAEDEHEEVVDPILTALRDAASDRDRADAAVRRIIAYAREYLPSRREYSRRVLATASGRSESWVGNAYGDNERNAVAHIVASVRPAPTADTELEAMNALVAMDPDKRAALMASGNPTAAFGGLSDAAIERIRQWAHQRYGTGQAAA